MRQREEERLAKLGSTMRVLRPFPNVFAFYDGRIEGKRACSEERNWLDDGAYVLGISTYAILVGSEALVYDTHISLAHARIIRKTLSAAGATKIRVVLRQWRLLASRRSLGKRSCTSAATRVVKSSYTLRVNRLGLARGSRRDSWCCCASASKRSPRRLSSHRRARAAALSQVGI